MKIENLNKDMKILVVDDFVTMRRIISGILQQLGFTNIEEAEDGRVALTKLKADKFEFVVSDWNMPRMMGIELLHAVRSDPNLSSTPFLIVTPDAQRDNVAEATQLGLSSYIVKPFSAETFATQMSAVFETVEA